LAINRKRVRVRSITEDIVAILIDIFAW